MKSRRVARTPCGVGEPPAGVPASSRRISQGGAWSCSGMISPPCSGTIVVGWLWRGLLRGTPSPDWDEILLKKDAWREEFFFLTPRGGGAALPCFVVGFTRS